MIAEGLLCKLSESAAAGPGWVRSPSGSTMRARPSPVERLLAHIAASSYFAHRMHEAYYAASGSEGGMTLAQSEPAQRRMDRAHRRFLSTVKTLAAVRRLALPTLQINVAQRQQIAQLNGGGSS
jgi:hypothetical protein